MKRILLKTVLIIILLWIGGTIIGLMIAAHFGALPTWIIAAGMIAGIRAIWKYNPTSKEIDLKKDD